MKKLNSMLSIAILIFITSPMEMAQPGPTSWANGYSLVLLDCKNMKQAKQVRDYIESQGGRIALILSKHAMTGWISPDIVDSLVRSQHRIKAVYHNSVSPETVEYQDAKTRFAVKFFNSVVSGEITRKIAARATVEKVPLMDDSHEAPPISYNDYIQNLKQLGIDVEDFKNKGLLINQSPNAAGNSDAMTGTVAMGMFFVESNGGVEPDLYDWTAEAVTDMLNQAATALSWWASQAPGYGANVSFSIVYWDPIANPTLAQGYEPLNGTHSFGDVPLWINEIMSNFGINSGDHITRVAAFNTWLKGDVGTDWAYTAFVCYNPAPAPTTYNDGYFAWAYLGGPYTQLLYRNNGWEISDFAQTLAHETGHVFNACDEYYQAGYGGCTSCDPCLGGGVPNGNCEYCNADSVPCLMRTGPWVLCCYTPGQVGWPWSMTDCQSSTNPPEAPSRLSARAPRRRGTIRLRWRDNSDNEDGFIIELKRGNCTSGRPWREIADVAANTARYLNRRLKPGTEYAYRVRAYNANGDSGYSNCRSATTQP